jgi:AraC family transcriptional regulator
MGLNSISGGGNDMNCRSIEKPSFDIIGKSRKFTEANEESLAGIPRFWDELMNETNGGKVFIDMTQNRPGVVTGSTSLGVSMCRAGIEEFSYAIGVETTVRTVPLGFEVIHVPAATWAVFDSIGPIPGAILDVEKRIFSDWFPATGYEHPEYELEVYLPGDRSSNDYHCQVWIHVNRKK